MPDGPKEKDDQPQQAIHVPVMSQLRIGGMAYITAGVKMRAQTYM